MHENGQPVVVMPQILMTNYWKAVNVCVYQKANDAVSQMRKFTLPNVVLHSVLDCNQCLNHLELVMNRLAWT